MRKQANRHSSRRMPLPSMLMRQAMILLFLFLSVLAANAQSKKFTGKVTGADGTTPLSGVSVTIKGTAKGATTDGEGRYAINANAGQTLVFSYVGFASQEILLSDGQSVNDVSLKAGQSTLNEVVVVGYGTQKKGNLTGAVATVDVARTFDSKPLTDPAKALQGVVPGLTITYGNGGLTAGSDIKIRGIGSVSGASRPLILVDNVQTDDITLVNPNDIESISVLKDAASASIYGARAAFGVILIKTKSGKRNQKSTISYSNNFSWNTPTVLPDFADPVQELQGMYESAVRAQITPEIFGMQLQTLRNGIIKWKENYASKNTGLEMIKGEDWNIENDGRTYFYKVWDPKKEMLNKYTFSQIQNLTFQGGSEKINYYVSGNYSYDGGIFKMNPDAVKKYNITAGINASVTPWLDLSVKTLYRNYEYDYPFNYQSAGYWYYFWRWGAYFPYGTYQGNYFRTNSAYLAGASKSSLVDNYNRIDLGATIKINKDFNIRADYTIVRENALRHETGGPIQAWDFWTTGQLNLTNIATAAQDAVTYTAGRYLINTLNAYATYQKTLANAHNFKVIGGVNVDNNENINFFATRRGLLDPSQGELNLATGDQLVGGSSGVTYGYSRNGHGKKAYAGYFGRLNYDYQGKYLLELNGRYDGSSSFPAQDRWAFFGSASAGYRISQESFFEPLKSTINDWKLRASYGEIGNQDLGATNLFLRNMTGIQASWMNGTTYAQSIGQPQAVANSLQWERVSTLDFGTDIRFLKNHLGVSFDWYERNTKGMIQSVTVPASFGVSGPNINAGNFRNRGYEISIDGNFEVAKDFNMYATVTLADGKTVFTKWNNPNNSISTALNYVGKTYGEIWGFETDGYFTDKDQAADFAKQKTLQSGNFVYGPGDVKFKDLNGDGVINGGKMTLDDHGDLKVIGNTQPRYQYSARIGGTWKELDFDIFIQGVGKRNYWGVGNVILPMYQGTDILYANQLDYWTPTNTNAFYPRLYSGNGSGTVAGLSAGGNNFYPQTKYLLNLAYCRLKNVTIGYSLPKKMLTKYGIQKLRAYVSGQNLLTISNVGAPIDPEITDGDNGFTGRTYPFARTYSFGLQLTL